MFQEFLSGLSQKFGTKFTTVITLLCSFNYITQTETKLQSMHNEKAATKEWLPL